MQTKKSEVIITIVLASFFISCSEDEEKKAPEAILINDRSNTDENLYLTCGKLVRTYDTMWVYNSTLDTVVIDTGIFSKLLYDYPLWVDASVLKLTREALELEKNHEPEKAQELYRKIIENYRGNFPPPLPESDMVSYHRFLGNSAMLYSYAFEKRSNLDEAIRALKRYMVEMDLKQIRIRERYIELLIKKLGKDSVQYELENCSKTVYCKKYEFTDYCVWTVKVFGADVYIASPLEYKEMNPETASLILRQQDFYKLTKSPLRYREVYED